jgi:hypothetical protein
MVSALMNHYRKEVVDMLLSYNKNPFQYNWTKLFTNLFWLFLFLMILAIIVKTLTEQ